MPEACSCELVDGQWSNKYPRSEETLVVVTPRRTIMSCVEQIDYRCTRCGATLQHYIQDRAPENWERTDRSQ